MEVGDAPDELLCCAQCCRAASQQVIDLLGDELIELLRRRREVQQSQLFASVALNGAAVRNKRRA